MFVQIGNRAFNPDNVVSVDFFPDEEFVAVNLNNSGGKVTEFFQDADYRAFMDWWERCATVIHPKPQRVVIRYSNDGREPRIAPKPPYIEVEFQFEHDGAAYHCESCGREAILFTVTKHGDKVPLCESCADIFELGQANPRGGIYDIEDYLTEEEKYENSLLDDGDLRRDEEAIRQLEEE